MTHIEDRLRDYFRTEPPADAQVRRRITARLTNRPRSQHRRAALAGVAGALTIVLIASLTIATRRGANPASSTSPGLRHGTLTDAEYDLALSIAQSDRVEQAARKITIATAIVEAGTVTDSANLGNQCTSGKLLTVTVIGDFAIPVTGLAQSPGADPPSVHAMIITADPESGQECRLTVKTGDVAPDPSAVVLFRR